MHEKVKQKGLGQAGWLDGWRYETRERDREGESMQKLQPMHMKSGSIEIWAKPCSSSHRSQSL